jgi:hypothetical protein
MQALLFATAEFARSYIKRDRGGKPLPKGIGMHIARARDQVCLTKVLIAGHAG